MENTFLSLWHIFENFAPKIRLFVLSIAISSACLASPVLCSSMQSEVEAVNAKIAKKERDILKRTYHFQGFRIKNESMGLPVENMGIKDSTLSFNLELAGGKTLQKRFDLLNEIPKSCSNDFCAELDSHNLVYFRYNSSRDRFVRDIHKLTSYYKIKKAILADIFYRSSNRDKPNSFFSIENMSSFLPKTSLSRYDQDIYNQLKLDEINISLKEFVSGFKKNLCLYTSSHTLDTKDTNQTNITKNAMFSELFFEMVHQVPHLINELDVVDLVHIFKHIKYVCSSADETSLKLFIQFFDIENYFLTAYQVRNDIIQTETLHSIREKSAFAKEDFFDFLRHENDLLFLASNKSQFVPEKSFADELTIKNLKINEHFIQRSSARIGMAVKYFLQLHPESGLSTVQSLINEKLCVENQYLQLDFAVFGRFAEAGSILTDLLKSKIDFDEGLIGEFSHDVFLPE